jgi:NCAIR mutase (PurE)-related protein
MDVTTLKDLLNNVKAGKINIDDALRKLKELPFEDIGFASIDHHRSLRRGFSEVIYGPGKKAEEILKISGKMTERGENVLITRLTYKKARIVKEHFPQSEYYPGPKALTIVVNPIEKRGKGKLSVRTC